MCVAVNKSLQFYYWKNRNFFPLRDDLSIPDTPRALSWCKEVILLGFKNEYCQLDVINKIVWFNLYIVVVVNCRCYQENNKISVVEINMENL